MKYKSKRTAPPNIVYFYKYVNGVPVYTSTKKTNYPVAGISWKKAQKDRDKLS